MVAPPGDNVSRACAHVRNEARIAHTIISSWTSGVDSPYVSPMYAPNDISQPLYCSRSVVGEIQGQQLAPWPLRTQSEQSISMPPPPPPFDTHEGTIGFHPRLDTPTALKNSAYAPPAADAPSSSSSSSPSFGSADDTARSARGADATATSADATATSAEATATSTDVAARSAGTTVTAAASAVVGTLASADAIATSSGATATSTDAAARSADTTVTTSAPSTAAAASAAVGALADSSSTSSSSSSRNKTADKSLSVFSGGSLPDGEIKTPIPGCSFLDDDDLEGAAGKTAGPRREARGEATGSATCSGTTDTAAGGAAVTLEPAVESTVIGSTFDRNGGVVEGVQEKHGVFVGAGEGKGEGTGVWVHAAEGPGRLPRSGGLVLDSAGRDLSFEAGLMEVLGRLVCEGALIEVVDVHKEVRHNQYITAVLLCFVFCVLVWFVFGSRTICMENHIIGCFGPSMAFFFLLNAAVKNEYRGTSCTRLFSLFFVYCCMWRFKKNLYACGIFFFACVLIFLSCGFFFFFVARGIFFFFTLCQFFFP